MAMSNMIGIIRRWKTGGKNSQMGDVVPLARSIPSQSEASGKFGQIAILLSIKKAEFPRSVNGFIQAATRFASPQGDCSNHESSDGAGRGDFCCFHRATAYMANAIGNPNETA